MNSVMGLASPTAGQAAYASMSDQAAALAGLKPKQRAAGYSGDNQPHFKIDKYGRIVRLAGGGDFITSGPMPILVGDNPSGRERVTVTPLGSGVRRGASEVHIHIGQVMGTDRRAARQLARMVGDELMGGVMRGMVGQNA